MNTAITTRGEFGQKIADKTIIFKIGLAQLKQIEQVTGRPVLSIANAIHTRQGVPLPQLFAICWIGGQAGPNAQDPCFVKTDLFEQLLYEELGLAGILELVTNLLFVGMGGKVSEESNPPTTPP